MQVVHQRHRPRKTRRAAERFSNSRRGFGCLCVVSQVEDQLSTRTVQTSAMNGVSAADFAVGECDPPNPVLTSGMPSLLAGLCTPLRECKSVEAFLSVHQRCPWIYAEFVDNTDTQSKQKTVGCQAELRLASCVFLRPQSRSTLTAMPALFCYIKMSAERVLIRR